MTDKRFNYTKALREIEGIVKKLESEEPDIDELSELVKRATSLIKQCKQKLKETDEDLQDALGEFDSD
jgi:exodeoxyribonuclease VII small subunit